MRAVAVLALVALALPAMVATASAKKEKTLYDKLGGKKGVTAVVNDFVANLEKDTRVSSFFSATVADPERMKTFKTHLYEQICQASGGPCTYSGSMKTARMAVGIKTGHFQRGRRGPDRGARLAQGEPDDKTADQVAGPDGRTSRAATVANPAGARGRGPSRPRDMAVRHPGRCRNIVGATAAIGHPPNEGFVMSATSTLQPRRRIRAHRSSHPPSVAGPR
jgi:hemoglobin